ncbi:hypothetical protein GQ600_8630 [Phytophthora cactorum]|nr:hypothetical protein GQ600_8630 [Phytophthora cactorum]
MPVKVDTVTLRRTIELPEHDTYSRRELSTSLTRHLSSIQLCKTPTI